MTKYVILVIAVACNSIGVVMLRHGMKTIMTDGNSDLWRTLLHAGTHWNIWNGLVFYAISFPLYMYLLAKFEVSYIYPIIVALLFILVLVFSSVFLNEPVTARKLVSIIIILAGIVFAFI